MHLEHDHVPMHNQQTILNLLYEWYHLKKNQLLKLKFEKKINSIHTIQRNVV